jgi:hypothetical protein
VTVLAEAAGDAPLRDVLAAALEANERLARLADELRAENARLAEELACRDGRIEELYAELAVLQRLVFGRSSERAARCARRDGTTAGNRAGGGTDGRPRGPGPGRDGGITRICPGSRWSGISRTAGARSHVAPKWDSPAS